jgi:hypothetical protein
MVGAKGLEPLTSSKSVKATDCERRHIHAVRIRSNGTVARSHQNDSLSMVHRDSPRLTSEDLDAPLPFCNTPRYDFVTRSFNVASPHELQRFSIHFPPIHADFLQLGCIAFWQRVCNQEPGLSLKSRVALFSK